MFQQACQFHDETILCVISCHVHSIQRTISLITGLLRELKWPMCNSKTLAVDMIRIIPQILQFN
jgi:hypothetical protein